jgi:heme A synthase
VVCRKTDRRGVRALALAAPLLAVVQVALGILSITTFLDAAPVTAHLGVAAALLADCVILHLVSRGTVAVPADAATPVAVEVAA